jgi:fimbrial chaperone protein
MLLGSSAVGPVAAQSIRVSPVTIDLPAGAVSSVLTLDTNSKEGVSVQARVFRWSQADGEDKLEKTDDVVISPPVLTVHDGAPATLRLVRVAKTPVSGEETYRILLDEIPERKKLQSGSVALAVRQSLPVFFTGIDIQPAAISWKVVGRKGKLTLAATNSGQKRVRLFKVSVTDEKNKEVLRSSLAYVLGGQTRAWELSGPAAGKTLTIKAESDTGPVNASAVAGRSG